MNLLPEGKELTPNILDEEGQTPPLLAAEMGQGGVVKLFLGRGDVSLDMPDYSGVTPLSLTMILSTSKNQW